MDRLIIALLLLISIPAFADEIEIPDEMEPFENNSEILFSYEFDELPKFIEKIGDNKFIILVLDDEDAILYTFDANTNKIDEKKEFYINDDEYLEEYKVVGNKLLLYFKTYETSSFFGSDGYYVRVTTVSLDTFEPIDSEIIYTTQLREDYDHEDINDDMDYARREFNEGMFIDVEKLEEMEIEIEDNSSFIKVYNEKDSSKYLIFNFIGDDDLEKDYIRFTFYNNNTVKPKNNLVLLMDSTDEKYYKRMLFAHLDDNSNFFFIYSWTDEDTEKRYITFNKLTPSGELTTKKKEIPYEIDDEEYKLIRFNKYKDENGKISTLGFARYDDDDSDELAPIIALYKLDLDTKTLDFELTEKYIDEDEGELLNNDEDIFRFARISDIVVQDDGLVLLTENTMLQVFSTYSEYGTSYYYVYTFNDINLFKLDNEMNIVWNNFTDRDIQQDGGIFGNHISAIDYGAQQIVLKPELEGDNYTYTYSTTEPDDYIIRVTYNIKTGEKEKETILFENDGVPSYSPGFQFPLGNNEFVTTLKSDDYYLVKYKLNK